MEGETLGKQNGGASPKGWVASIHPGPNRAMPQRFAKLAEVVKRKFQTPVLAIVQHPDAFEDLGLVGENLYDKVLADLASIPRGTPLTVIVDSPGGFAGSAYRMATAIRRRCGFYFVVVPRRAKSAATLFCLGAQVIYMGENAELGPLDAQVWHQHREERISSLEVVNAVDGLNNEALKAIHAQMIFWAEASGKNISELLPMATKFVAEMMKPMFDKIDTIEFTKHSRFLNIAEEYAARLLSRLIPRPEAERTANKLTSWYPDHDFVIDFDEATELGLQVSKPKDDELMEAMNRLVIQEEDGTILGLLEERGDEGEQSETSVETSPDGQSDDGPPPPRRRRRRRVEGDEAGETPAG